MSEPSSFFFSLTLQPLWALASAFHFHDHFTDGRTPWISDQLVARPLPKHRTTQTQNKHIHTPNIHALCGIQTHNPSFRASEDSSCLRLLGCCDRLEPSSVVINLHSNVFVFKFSPIFSLLFPSLLMFTSVLLKISTQLLLFC
jgi:hypothetical protein